MRNVGKACDEDIPEASADLVRLHGRTATAFRSLGRDLQRWYWRASPEVAASDSVASDWAAQSPRAFVAYLEVRRARVAAGEPVASLDDLLTVAERFVDDSAARGQRASFFGTEGRLVQSPRFARRLLGEQPVWNPQAWTAQRQAHRSLREQCRRARAKGVVIQEVDPRHVTAGATGEAVQQLVTRWRATRSMSPMGFLVQIDFTTQSAARRVFLAQQNGQLVGLLAMAPVPARAGWLLEHLLRDPDAPNGTADLLVDHAMLQLAADGVTWASLGLAPLHGPVDGWLQRVRHWSRPLFNFEGLAAFKRKLRPDRWEPIYLAWPREGSGWRALLDGLRAFAGGSLLRFALRTIFRGPTPLLRALCWLLVPWTLVLAAAPTAAWFPHTAVHAAWVLFDVLLVVALWTLLRRQAFAPRTTVARRHTAQLALLLATCVSLDALLTAWQAWAFNMPRVHTVVDVVIVWLACLGPLVAAPVLWGAARRLRVLARPRPQLDWPSSLTT
jgi:phosphatidylglycerol lysyltransferase